MIFSPGRTGDFTPHLWIWSRWIHYFSLNVWKEANHFYMQFYVSEHITQPPQSSGIHNLLGWCKSGQGETCWFESCPCRSSEGARYLFYIQAKMVEVTSMEVLAPLLSRCPAHLGLYISLSIDSLLISVEPWKKNLVFTVFFYVLHLEGENSSIDSCKSSFGPSLTGRMYFNNKAYKSEHRNIISKDTNIWMPKCVKTISVDAMHLFEIYFDVAALLILELVHQSCGAVWGPFLALRRDYWWS